MDHLPIPLDASAHERVKFFVEDERPFSTDDFFNLPLKGDYKFEDFDELVEHGLNRKHWTKKKANQFLQEWLFFSLLAVVLRESIDPLSFVDSSRTVEKTTLTEGLDEFLAGWTLENARRFVSKHLSLENYDYGLNEEVRRKELHGIHKEVDKELALLIAVLGETLQGVRSKLIFSLENRSHFWMDRGEELGE